MINSYKEYLKQKKALPIEKMQTIHEELIEQIGMDEVAIELYEELLEVANRYASIRADWFFMSREEKMDKDPGRTSCHDSVITHLSMLERYFEKQGKSTKWREELGNVAEDPYNRKAIGDFACYLVFINSVNAR